MRAAPLSQRLAAARRAIEDGIEAGKAYKATITERAPADVGRLVDKSLRTRKAVAEPIAVVVKQGRGAIVSAKAGWDGVR